MLLLDKKGLSIMIGYVLLVAIAIIMSMVVYQFIKTYVPRDALACPESTSILIKETQYDCTLNKLDVTIKNNGRFDVAGYFIHATTSADQELATQDLSDKILEGGETHAGSVWFTSTGDNILIPGNKKTSKFDLTDVGTIYKIELIPVRHQEEEGKTRFVSCSNAKVEEILTCI